MNNIFKEIFDRIFAFFGLIILLPVMLIIALLIKIKMPEGPIIFKQKRVGKNGKLFTIYKFRTMKPNHSGSTISIAGESRITNFGKFLRKYKLDELPELWNILKGDMSFVGPRPDVPEYMLNLKGDEKKILELKPGLTGPATLKYSNEEEILSRVSNPKEYYDSVIFPDKVKINLQYYYNHSFISDIKIIFKTIFRKT